MTACFLRANGIERTVKLSCCALLWTPGPLRAGIASGEDLAHNSPWRQLATGDVDAN